jgi:hypothetical protein
MKVYAKCLDGEEETARHRIGSALGLPEAAPSTEDDDGDDGQAPVPVPA